ncbi:SusD/RagB family nutrient-binding outer membrane lipoprotein [Agriterribacter sp.]|uniref:SusD/RagB family nutrient-binding outer membrane lipoprotein n=1 Tax=Agriterribacter sp. TaxID=2821509 RepID=UPI002B589A43|nr:SusD/RagB family nutrient-binding outer membrane lipoprotein [Agriterribacter sp.]HTN07803.1 SusD/RagB family nutrient-binding outer membrane lipoprotein [Agriterribacter sp.]
MKYAEIKGISLISILFILLIGCKKDDKYFVSPNDPTSATLPTLLAALEVSTINSYEGDLARTAGMLVQHGVGVEGQATQVNGYTLSENSFDNQWSQIYQAINSGDQLLAISGGDENPRYRGITKIVMAMNWGLLTDLWGDIPYTEAVAGIKFPKYDSQESVLAGIQTLLSEGITDLASAADQNAFLPGADDIIFGGDVELWSKTAWTLKARYLNRLSNKSDYNPTDILDALSKGIASQDDDCMGKHGDGDNDHNQWYDFLNERAYVTASAPFVDSLLLRPADTRIFYYFDSSGFGNTVVGSPVAVPEVDVSYWGSYLAAGANTPTPLVTYFEALFIKAEVLARQGSANAADVLNDAIKASCKKVTAGAYDGSSIATYTTANTTVSRVMYEKWLAMFGQVEVYTDYRRTGYPNLTPNPLGATSGHIIPKRFPTPLTERTTNTNAPTPAITDPVWWAQ